MTLWTLWIWPSVLVRFFLYLLVLRTFSLILNQVKLKAVKMPPGAFGLHYQNYCFRLKWPLRYCCDHKMEINHRFKSIEMHTNTYSFNALLAVSVKYHSTLTGKILAARKKKMYSLTHSTLYDMPKPSSYGKTVTHPLTWL